MSTEVMERPMERPTLSFHTSPSLVKFAPAFVKAQTAMGVAVKGKANPFFKSKYADLAEVIEVCKDPLNENGISFLQPVVSAITPPAAWEVPKELAELVAAPSDKLKGDDYVAALDALFGSRPKPKIAVCTILLHESGEWISSVAEFPTVKEDPQNYFATTTYLRRASLQAILGIPAEDDDGNTAAGKVKKQDDHLSKAMTQGFPPDTDNEGVLVEIRPPLNNQPPKVMIQTLDGVLGLDVYGDEMRFHPLLGQEVIYRYTKDGAKRPIQSMVKRGLEIPKPILVSPDPLPIPTKPTPKPLEPMDDWMRGTIEKVKVKTGAKGEYAILTITEAKAGTTKDVFCHKTPASCWVNAFDELEAQEIMFQTETSEGKNGKVYINIKDLFPADVFEQAMAEREAQQHEADEHMPHPATEGIGY